MIQIENNLYPSEGYRFLTNGEITSEWVTLGIYDSPTNWADTNEEIIYDVII